MDDNKILQLDNESFENYKLLKNYTGIVEWMKIYKVFYVCGKPHKEDGPAKIYWDGKFEWYINGKFISHEVLLWMNENNIPKDRKDWNKSHKLLFKLTFG